MSIEAVRWVLEKSRTKGAERMIMVVIAEHADTQGLAWPSIETIARLANCSPRYVKNTIRRLSQDELVIEKGGGRGRSNRYRIPIKRVIPASPINQETVIPASPIEETETVNSETQRVNSTTIKGEPQITRTIKNHHRTTNTRSRAFSKNKAAVDPRYNF